MSSHNLDLEERDLLEAPRLAKDTPPRGLIAGGCLAVVLFLALLVYGSLPELSPQEIVAMDGYAGEQPAKHIFNIHSLEESTVKQADQASAKMEATVEPEKPIVVTTSVEPELNEPEVAAPAPSDPVEIVQTQPVEAAADVSADIDVIDEDTDVAVAEPTPEPVEEAAGEEVVIISEVTSRTPRVTRFDTGRENRVVAAMATTPTIDEASDTVVVSSVAAIEPVPVPTGASAPAQAAKGKLLPLRSVLADLTELKASPTTQSKTLLSLERGVIVTAFERHGKWIHIGTNDGSSITGYVLESSLGRVDAKNSG